MLESQFVPKGISKVYPFLPSNMFGNVFNSLRILIIITVFPITKNKEIDFYLCLNVDFYAISNEVFILLQVLFKTKS